MKERGREKKKRRNRPRRRARYKTKKVVKVDVPSKDIETSINHKGLIKNTIV